jgi:hypothetical protein
MGNANGYVHNDTDGELKVYSFNYADAYRTVPFNSKTVQKGETVKFEAAAHGSGLIVATGRNQSGRHYALGITTRIIAG